jgi:hypothetical protein
MKAIMIIESIIKMLERCSAEDSNIPKSFLYNEGWLLRLVLDWFSKHNYADHPLKFLDEAKWYSEGKLSSTFLARYKGDEFAEGYTNIDGIIGHFIIGDHGKSDIRIDKPAKQFIVLEAKIFSPLSTGITNARYYDQAARTVGCICETLNLSNVDINKMDILSFYVIAPKIQIDKGIFKEQMSRESISEKVKRRVCEYNTTEKNIWLRDHFESSIERINIECISWEDLISYIDKNDPNFSVNLNHFYRCCLQNH